MIATPTLGVGRRHQGRPLSVARATLRLIDRGDLLADILDLVHSSSLAAKDQPAPPLTEELSPGELRVLRYLPTNLSRSEIAGELSVSRHTVSTHISSIYAKLGVADRSAAVRRARELLGRPEEHGR